MKEHSVPCEWCSAKVGEPCRDNHDNALNNLVHRPRLFQYNWENGLPTPLAWRPTSHKPNETNGEKKNE